METLNPLAPHEGMDEIFRPTSVLEGLSVPETWQDVRDFAVWWLENGRPFIPPHDFEVYRSDDATSICMFRKGRFQVELYLIFPEPNLPVHEHPGVEVIKYRPDSEGFESLTTSAVLRAGRAHGAGLNFKENPHKGMVGKGFPLLAFQHWDEGLEMTTVAARWKGKTVGPRQEDLIRRFNPNAYVIGGWADVTRNKE